MRPVFSTLESKTKHYNRVLQLRGKLDLIVQQLTADPEEETAEPREVEKEAMLVYQVDTVDRTKSCLTDVNFDVWFWFQDDDSSDDLTEKLDDMLMPASDTDNDDWGQDMDEVDGSNSEDDGDAASSSDDEPMMANGVESESENDDVDDEESSE